MQRHKNLFSLLLFISFFFFPFNFFKTKMSLSRFNYEEYDSLKAKLDQQVKEHQPEDLLQFCSTFFQSQLEKERNASHHAGKIEPKKKLVND